MAGLVLLFNGAWLTHFFALRTGLFATSGEGMEAFATLTRRRLGTQRRWMIAARRWVVAL